MAKGKKRQRQTRRPKGRAHHGKVDDRDGIPKSSPTSASTPNSSDLPSRSSTPTSPSPTPALTPASLPHLTTAPECRCMATREGDVNEPDRYLDHRTLKLLNDRYKNALETQINEIQEIEETFEEMRLMIEEIEAAIAMEFNLGETDDETSDILSEDESSEL